MLGGKLRGDVCAVDTVMNSVNRVQLCTEAESCLPTRVKNLNSLASVSAAAAACLHGIYAHSVRYNNRTQTQQIAMYLQRFVVELTCNEVYAQA